MNKQVFLESIWHNSQKLQSEKYNNGKIYNEKWKEYII